MNYKPFVGFAFYGATTDSQRANYFASWGLLPDLPLPTLGGFLLISDSISFLLLSDGVSYLRLSGLTYPPTSITIGRSKWTGRVFRWNKTTGKWNNISS